MKFENILGHHGTAVAKRLGWKQGDEEDGWSKKAIESLKKKLQQHDVNALTKLEITLQSEGRQRSDCVTIPRSLDGRLQISHRKALPHVIYCRVYRWPDLQSHRELKAIDDCRFCFESGQQDICINPYHYERIEIAGILPPVVVPRYTEPPPNTVQLFPYNLTSLPCSTGFNSNDPISIPCHETDKMDTSTSYPTANPMVEVPYEDGKYWATVTYYELNTRVGEQHGVSSPTVRIDGFTDPTGSPDKISLGMLSNVNRNQPIEATRRHIGKGVKLTYVPYQGTLFAECLSESAIFIQSRLCNHLHNFHPTTVCKISHGISLKIFDMAKFRELLSQATHCHSFDSSYDLTKMALIRLSFVKGWGAEYQRQDVTSTPCWVEIRLHAPLRWLDKVLKQMGPSRNPISSIS